MCVCVRVQKDFHGMTVLMIRDNFLDRSLMPFIIDIHISLSADIIFFKLDSDRTRIYI